LFKVIITSYGVVNEDYRQKATAHAKKKLKTSSQESKEESDFDDLGSLLGQVEWHRIVLDEAQFIRNRFVPRAYHVRYPHSYIAAKQSAVSASQRFEGHLDVGAW
jgi:hypothetical protein